MLGTAHLVAFGYMIFWVDWLGWDIIEPLTFSVGCLYFLISLRFYRKYRIDRTPNSINEAIRNWSLRAK